MQYIGSIQSLYGTSYGMMVFTKAVLLVILPALGFVNRRSGRRPAAEPHLSLQRRRFVELEIFIGLAAFMLAASLSSAPPGADLAGLGEQVTPQGIRHRVVPRMPHFDNPDPKSLAMAVLGLIAGGARWLELRGYARAWRIAGAVWRIAFIVVGLLLLGYQEA